MLMGELHIVDLIRGNKIDLVLTIPSVGKDSARDGFQIRRAVIDFNIPYITTLTGAEAAIKAVEISLKQRVGINSINVYHRQVKYQRPLISYY